MGFIILVFFAFSANAFSQTLLSAFDFGGGDQNVGASVTTDVGGNALVTGRFQGTADFDPGPGVFNLTSKGNYDIFVAKYDPAGHLIFAFSIGSTGGYDWGNGIATDAAGNIVITGKFSGTADFDPGPGVTNLTPIGTFDDDIFVAKYDSMGHLIFAFNIGGTVDDVGGAVATDASGNVLVTGTFDGTVDFDPGIGVTNLTTKADINLGERDPDIFVAKYDPTGNLVFAFSIPNGLVESWPSDPWDAGTSIASDTLGNVLVTGYFQGTADFDPGPGTTSLGGDYAPDIFIAKYDPMGHLLFAFDPGGEPNYPQYGHAVATDAADNIIVAGMFDGADLDFDPGPGVAKLSSSAYYDAFIAKYNRDGKLIFAFKLDGSSTYPYSESVQAIATDAAGNIFATGYFDNTVDFNPSPSATILTTNGFDDVFLAEYDPSGNLLSAFSVGGTSGYNDIGYGIATDTLGNVVITGQLAYNDGNSGIDFDPGAGVTNLFVTHLTDTFLARYAYHIESVDSDKDGLVDNIEAQLGTDPLNPDTDGDGLLDGEEDNNHNGVVDSGETNPLKRDTDGDGFSDGYEVKAGSDPLNPLSIPPNRSMPWLQLLLE